MKSLGTFTVSNVGSNNRECSTLTYTIKDVGSIDDVEETRKKLDKVHEEGSIVTVSVSNYGTEDEQTDMKYQIKTCTSEKKAKQIKADLDKIVRKQGGQTTLDEV